jgi:hypothetical protein
MLTADLPLWTLATWQWVCIKIIRAEDHHHVAQVLLKYHTRGISGLEARHLPASGKPPKPLAI